MKRDTRNNYAVFWRGRYQFEVRGYRDALAARHDVVERHARECSRRGSSCILDTLAVSECAGCSDYCRATISKEVR